MKKLKIAILAAVLMMSTMLIVGCTTGDNALLRLKTENNVTEVSPGGTVQLIATAVGAKLEGLSYEIKQGDSFVSITDEGLLTVSETAIIGTEIKIIARIAGLKSNSVSLTVVHVPLTGITLSADKTNVLPGGTARLTKVLTPANTTYFAEYEIIEGSDIAELEGDRVLVSETAASGSLIKIKAVCGDIESSVVTITVRSLASEEYYVSLDDVVTVMYPTNSATKIITADVRNGEYQPVSGQNVEFEVIEGSQYLAISQSDYNCTLSVLGHGTAVVKATLDNDRSDTIIVKCIKTPEQIEIPDVFLQRNDIHYAVSNRTPLPFSATASGDKVCPNVNYVFEKGTYDEDILKFIPETVVGEVGTYNKITNQIEFNSSFKGIARFTVISNSGNTGNEVSNSQVFAVNDGINVSTWEEFSSALKNNYLNPGKPINIVVLNKLGNGYNYELVPSGILNNTQNNTYLTDLHVESCGSLNLNGNSHAINLTGMKQHSDTSRHIFSYLISVNPITKNVLDMINSHYVYEVFNLDELLEAFDQGLAEEFVVNINDFTLIGNNSVEGVNNENKFGSFDEGIRIGWKGYPNKDEMYFPDKSVKEYFGKVACKLTMNNIDVSKFVIGMHLQHIVDGQISNATVSNCFETGMKIYASTVTLENMNYVYNGGFGLDIQVDGSDKAGVSFDEIQQVTLAGSVSGYNLHNGETPHIQSLNGLISQVFPGSNLTILDLLKFSLGENSDLQRQSLSNVTTDEKGYVEYSFVGLLFNAPAGIATFIPNPSIVSSDEIIDYSPDMGKNTTHKYIRLVVPNNVNPSATPVAHIIAANLNYVGQK